MNFMKCLVKISQEREARNQAIAHMAAGVPLPVDLRAKFDGALKDLSAAAQDWLEVYEHYEDIVNGK